LLLMALPAVAATKSVTLFLDGARVESDVAATGTYLEIPLPAGASTDSLRIRPLGNARLNRVELAPAKPEPKVARELARLTERRELLQDRLKALATREDIFKAAAKSQSGKAPKKTKTNPEPLASVKQGTEFAIAQLEGVYQARRKTEHELKNVEEQLATLKKNGNADGTVARVWLAGKGGRVKASYIQPDLKWQPAYDVSMQGSNRVEVVLRADFPQQEKGAVVTVIPSPLATASPDTTGQPVAGPFAQVASYTFPVEKEQVISQPQPAVTFSFKNQSDRTLPPGQATCYRQGEYLGRVPFDLLPPGDVRELSCGR
jgi:hypothetical protein